MLYKFFMYLRELPKNNIDIQKTSSDSCTGMNDEGEHEWKMMNEWRGRKVEGYLMGK